MSKFYPFYHNKWLFILQLPRELFPGQFIRIITFICILHANQPVIGGVKNNLELSLFMQHVFFFDNICLRWIQL